MNRKQIREQAKLALKANYWPMVGLMLLYAVISGAASGIAGIIPGVGPVASIGVSVFFIFPLGVAVTWMCYRVFTGAAPQISDLFATFNNESYFRSIGSMALICLYTFLWSLLFVIPGIIKGISYSLAPFMIMDDPSISAGEAITKSKNWTNGYKADIFLIELGFIGWYLLVALTFGIVGIFYVVPYQALVMGGVYAHIKAIREGESTVVNE